MKLLVTTQVVDKSDPALGFFHQWVEEFAKHLEHIEVICLKEGDHTFPHNVTVHSLGKEKGARSRLCYSYEFLRLIVTLRRKYDAVFVHMNPEYVILGGLFWRAWGKRISLWYAHKSVTFSLRIASVLVDIIYTASRESFRSHSRKLRIVGHGIPERLVSARPSSQGILRLLTAGRISRSKNLHLMESILESLYTSKEPFTFTVVGSAITSRDEEYEKELREKFASSPYASSILWKGPVPATTIPELLAEADVFINLSETGSLDKAVLEALRAGVPAVTSNEAFKELLSPYGIFVDAGDTRGILKAIMHARSLDIQPLTKQIQKEHSLETLIPKIILGFTHR